MPKYEVRLESQTDSQARITTLVAESADEARLVCEEKERDLIAYSLDDDPYLTDAERVSIRGGDYKLLESGKVTGPVARYRGKLHAHNQEKPYLVVSVEEV